MTRPFYESGADLKNEQEILAVLKPRWGFDSAYKQPLKYGLDYCLIRDRSVKCFAEIKHRPGLSFNYGDGYYLALDKVTHARNATAATGLPCLFVVRFVDMRIFWIDLATPVQRTVWHGRTDRNDPDDMEPCCVLMWDSFKQVR